jgi:tRNA(Ile)-lysidine synthase
VAVSGGADSLAAALLTRDWALAQGGRVVGLIVDHGLRPESPAEAEFAAATLAGLGIPPTVLTLHGLVRGPGLAARARIARHAALERECAARGILHLVFGHHARDQAETLLLREAAGSGERGLAGMPALVETPWVRRLRPLLATPPGRLRATLRAAGLGWVEDPSNQDPLQARVRARMRLDDPGGTGTATLAECARARRFGEQRRARDAAIADVLAQRVRLHPEGFALLRPGPIRPDALAALLGMISGAVWPPSSGAVAALAADPRPATLAGVRLAHAGRLGPWLLLVREPAAMALERPAVHDSVWDGRYRLLKEMPAGATIGAWGPAAEGDRRGLPHLVLRSLPVVRLHGEVIARGPGAVFAHRPRLGMTGGCFFPFGAIS